MLRVPYINVKQKSETFFLTKFKATDLKGLVSFHMRDPYIKSRNEDEEYKFEQYIRSLEDKGIKFDDTEKEVQRRLSLNRVIEIKEFIENKSNFLPNSIILSVDVTASETFEEEYVKYLEEEVGYLHFDDRFKFMIIDGQHRLAGIFSASDSLLSEMEILSYFYSMYLYQHQRSYLQI